MHRNGHNAILQFWNPRHFLSQYWLVTKLCQTQCSILKKQIFHKRSRTSTRMRQQWLVTFSMAGGISLCKKFNCVLIKSNFGAKECLIQEHDIVVFCSGRWAEIMCTTFHFQGMGLASKMFSTISMRLTDTFLVLYCLRFCTVTAKTKVCYSEDRHL